MILQNYKKSKLKICTKIKNDIFAHTNVRELNLNQYLIAEKMNPRDKKTVLTSGDEMSEILKVYE